MKALFKSVNIQRSTQELIEHVHEVIEDYQAQGLKLTLRQAYYQLVTRNLITNEEKSYKRLGKAISTGRLAGYLDWDAIEDRGRVPKRPAEWNNVKQIVESAVHSYRLPRLKGQKEYVELWVEKEALAGVLAPIASRYHVTLMVNKGYSSQSAMFESASRIDSRCRADAYAENGGDKIAKPVILYLGDFDPSGEDMVRDIEDRLGLFLQGYEPVDNAEEWAEVTENLISPTGWNTGSCGTLQIEVEKIAITKPQIEMYEPPPNPAKLSDSRAKAFIEEHGANSWEVDALPPQVLTEIVSKAIEDHLDMDLMQKVIDREQKDKAMLRDAAKRIMEGY